MDMKPLLIVSMVLLATLATSPGRAGVGRPLCGGMVPTMLGTAGDDHLEGTSGSDVIVGLAGSDVIVGNGGTDRLCGGQGNDTLMVGPGGADVYGGPGDDRAIAEETAYGEMGPGNDYSMGLSEAHGGAGNDELRVRPEQAADLSGGRGNDKLVGGNQDPHYTGSEDILRGGPGDDMLLGKGTLNFIEPGPGRDYVHMGWKRQTWTGGLRYPDASGVMVDLKRGFVIGQGRDELHGRITSVWGSPAEDVLKGTDRGDSLVGEDGDDRLYGRGGTDRLDGGRGSDAADGGPGEDSCVAEAKKGCP